MSVEQNSGSMPVSVYGDPSAAKHLLVRYPEQSQLIPYTPKPSRMGSLSGEPGTKRYAPFMPSSYSNPQAQPKTPESAYNSSLGLVTPKMNQVGLLIDIYA